MAEYKKDLYSKYRNNYKPHNATKSNVPPTSMTIKAETMPQEIMDKYKVGKDDANKLYGEAKTAWISRAKKLNPSMTDAQIEAQWKAKGGR